MTPRVAISLAGFQAFNPDPVAAMDLAMRCEKLGCSSLWVPETAGAEAFSLLGAIAVRTRRMGLGTGIVPLQLRPPTVAAMGASTVQQLAADRDVWLGLGLSSPVIVEGWHGQSYGEKHLARVRDYVDVVRKCFSGDRVTHAGPYYQIKGFRMALPPSVRTPRVVLAALNPNMLGLSGELADSVLLGFPPLTEIVDAVGLVRDGERAAGRPAGSCRVMAYLRCAEPQTKVEFDRLRQDFVGYLLAPAYAKRYSRTGFERDVREVQALWRAGNRSGAVQAISEELLVASHLLGSSAEIARRVEEFVFAGVDDPILVPLPIAGDTVDATVDLIRNFNESQDRR